MSAQYDDIINNNPDCATPVATPVLPAGGDLPAPSQRKLESNELRLDGKLDLPINDQHFVVVGTQVLRGELEDGLWS